MGERYTEKAIRAKGRENHSRTRQHEVCEVRTSEASEDDISDPGSSGRAGQAQGHGGMESNRSMAVPASGARPFMTAYDEARLARLGEAAEATAAVLAAERAHWHNCASNPRVAQSETNGVGQNGMQSGPKRPLETYDIDCPAASHTLNELRRAAGAAAGEQGSPRTDASATAGVDKEPPALDRASSRCILCGAKASTFNSLGVSPDVGILKPCVLCGSERARGRQ